MKRFLKFLFNLARTISLLLVLGVVGIFTYLYLSGDLEKILTEFEKRSSPANRYGIFSAPEQNLKREEPLTKEKIAILADRSTHYLYPDQIAFFRKDGRHVKAATIDGDSITRIGASLQKIADLLEDWGDKSFFETASILINRKYVRQYLPKNMAAPDRSNYVYYVIMDTGDTLTVPKDLAGDFRRSMTGFAMSID